MLVPCGFTTKTTLLCRTVIDLFTSAVVGPYGYTSDLYLPAVVGPYGYTTDLYLPAVVVSYSYTTITDHYCQSW